MSDRALGVRTVMRPFGGDKDKLPSVYVRVAQLGPLLGYSQREEFEPFFYDDAQPGGRVIKARRVEEAVETADLAKIAHREGLDVILKADGSVAVGKPARGNMPPIFYEAENLRQALIKYQLATYQEVR